ncbi:hypothetical protein QFC22_004840 [Naganishia vaughanmartiniae]|uniref:Uncharacterized protein n=1 Tax=Naganishia vaughanmartiniae TaxID=1424756 RepID=A0ACC2WY27_9TREE|nr:hypothetical protein QFC22_004840 [Naganishia vaughanmartiniae]
MDDEQGPSTLYRARFAHTPDGLPAFSTFGTSGEPEDTEPLFKDQVKEREQEARQRDKDNLYALLNLPKSATTNQIRDRYRALAITFHPDKHRQTNTDDSDAPAASSVSHFNAIQRAYEILTDPQKRAVYDLLGEEGLRELSQEEHEDGEEGEAGGRRSRRQKWQIGRRHKTPAEIRQHYQRVVYERRLNTIDAMVKSKGDINVNVDARAVFLPLSFFKNPDVVQHDVLSRIMRTRVTGMGMKHSFETPISNATSVVWAGQMLARNGAGGGNVVGTVRHSFGPRFWVEAGSSIFNPRIGTAKATYAHDMETFATVNAVQQTYKAPPAVALTVGKKVFDKTTGFVTVRSGFWEIGPWGRGLAETLGRTDRPALSLGLTSIGHTGTGWTAEATGGFIDNHLSGDYTLDVLNGFKVKVGSAVGTATGVSAFVNTERQVTDNTKVGLGVTASLPGGITVKIRTIAELQAENAEYLAQKRAEAMDAMAMLEDSVQRKLEQERASEAGLVVISAHYGLASAFTPLGMREKEGEEEKVADVTIAVQALVQNGHLNIPAGRPKYNILGFYDPCMGEAKSLRVQYLFRDKLHEVTVDDMEALRAPLRTHIMDDSRNATGGHNWDA